MIDRKEVVKLIKTGEHSHADIARSMGCSRERIRQILKDNGISGRTEAGKIATANAAKAYLRDHVSIWTAEQDAYIRQHYNKKTAEDIAIAISKMFPRREVSRNSVIGRARRIGVARPRP